MQCLTSFAVLTFVLFIDEALISFLSKLFPDERGTSETDTISLQSEYLVDAFIEAAKFELKFIGGKDVSSSVDYRPSQMDQMGVESLTDECFARLQETKGETLKD